MALAFVFYACSERNRKSLDQAIFTPRFPCYNAFLFPDLIEKALRKLAGQALRNEIDVTKAWLSTLPVSPPTDRLYSPVVTYFILACPANF